MAKVSGTTNLQTRAEELSYNQIVWAPYLQSQTISHREHDFIVNLDDFGTKEIPDKHPELTGDALLILITRIKTESALQYLLFRIDDILRRDMYRAKIFCQKSWAPYMNLLNHRDDFIKHMTARIIAKLAIWCPRKMEPSILKVYVCWLVDQLKEPNNEYILSVARCLQVMLRIDDYRFVFESCEGDSTLLSILASKTNFQVQYQLIYCVWVLTFNHKLAEKMNKFNTIPILADILSDCVKEKVSRIVLAVFRNLIEKPKNPQVCRENCIAMIQCKVLKQLSILEQKRPDDEEIMNDVIFLTERLQALVQELTSFDQYATEIMSGRLEWSTVHKSVKFWRENAARLNEGKTDLLSKLLHLLETSLDPIVLAVACHDIGEYVRHYPKGKRIIEELGGKLTVMHLLSHEEPSVRYEALLAVQKLMVQNWEFLGKEMKKQQSNKRATGTKA